ncbi:MAG: DUF72 domain-containing protein [Myxococcota bacterium]
MLYVACSGFPVPVSRYWGLFRSVEISDTELGIPGAGTVRRWLRESPEGFAFTALAPKGLGESGFRRTKENKALVEAFAEFGATLGTQAIVFQAPDDFAPTRATKTAVKSFLGWLPDDLPQIVFDLPAWKTAEVEKVVGNAGAVAAYDPLQDDPPEANHFVYARLPGPAGHRSRYDEDSVDRLYAHCEAIDAKTAFCVFRNIDMQANGTALRAKIEG